MENKLKMRLVDWVCENFVEKNIDFFILIGLKVK
jgi:hypothetical protein